MLFGYTGDASTDRVKQYVDVVAECYASLNIDCRFTFPIVVNLYITIYLDLTDEKRLLQKLTRTDVYQKKTHVQSDYVILSPFTPVIIAICNIG